MPSMLHHITVFFDRDGTLNEDSGYITSPDELILFPGVGAAIARLKQGGSRVILVTNQSAIARGLMNEDDLHRIHRKLDSKLKEDGGCLDGIFYCPHHPDDGCACRKPSPGLVNQATKQFGLNLSRSYLVGDKMIDMQLANRVGSKAVLVTTSEYSQKAVSAMQIKEIQVACVAPSLCEAVNWIIQDAADAENK